MAYTSTKALVLRRVDWRENDRILTLLPKKHDPVSQREDYKDDAERFKKFFHLMLEEGVYLAPSAFEAGFMSLAHTQEDIQRTIDAARRCFAKL